MAGYRAWIAAAVVVAAASGCSGGGSGDSALAPEADKASIGVPQGSVRAEGALGEVAAEGRELVRTAEMTVVAKDVELAAVRAQELTIGREGYVYGQAQAASGGGRAILTLKVPPAGFRELLDELAGLGEQERREVATEDVTRQGVDLDARILSAQRSVDRSRSFLDAAKNVDELAGLEAELTRRETALEQLLSERQVLRDQVSLATITLTLTATPAPPSPVGDSLRSVPGFGGALASSIGAIVKIGRVLSAGAGYVLPFVALAGVPMWVVRRLVRRRRTARPVAATG